MKHIGKLAILGAMIASAQVASATPMLTGSLIMNDAGCESSTTGGKCLSYSYSGGVFQITNVNYDQMIISGNTITDPSEGGGTPLLGDYGNQLVIAHQNTSSTGSPLYLGTALSGQGDTGLTTPDAVEFIVTGWSTVTTSGSQFLVTAFGYYSDAASVCDGANNPSGSSNPSATVCGNAQFANTLGYDNITFDTAGGPTNNSVTEDFVTTPTPEPSSLMLLGTGLTGLAGMFYRRRRSIA